jgi:hypothetical protein
MAMQLDHVTIVAPPASCEAMRRFFVDIASMSTGPRPPFGVGGYWFYLGERPVIHLIASNARPAGEPHAQARIDHVALRVPDDAEWRALIARLEASGMPYQLADVPLSRERQLFVRLAPAVVIEFVTASA